MLAFFFEVENCNSFVIVEQTLQDFADWDILQKSVEITSTALTQSLEFKNFIPKQRKNI